MKKNVILILGVFLFFFEKILCSYKNYIMHDKLGGGKRKISYPYLVEGVENIEMEENVSIGPGSTIYTTGAKLKIASHVIVGPNLTVITGDHKYIAGRYLDSILASEKDKEYDKDVIIENDVWIGANVIILKGVTIGQSSIIAAGSLVVKDVPPFTIVGGVPAKVLKEKFNVEDKMKHQKFLDLKL